MNLHQANILIVDDDKDVLTAVRFLLKMEVKTILTETNPDNIHKLVTENDIDIILLDMNFRSSINTGNEGLFWLKEIKKRKPSLSVIMITAYADIDLAIKSLKEGAADFIVKPCITTSAEYPVGRHFGNRQLRTVKRKQIKEILI